MPYIQHHTYRSPAAHHSPSYLYRRQYYVGNTFLGEGACPAFIKNGEMFPPESEAYVCPYCGELWARIITLNEGRVLPFRTHTRQCEKHPWTFRFEPVPGSLDVYWPSAEIEHLPHGVVLRELQLRFIKEKDHE